MADMNYFLLLAVAIIVGLAYGLPGVFADWLKNGSKIDFARLGATIVYSIVVGIIAVQTGVLTLDNIVNWQTLLTPVWTIYMGFYLMMLYLFSKIVVPVVQQFTSRTTLFPKPAGIDPLHKMDEETRHWLVSDQKEPISSGVLRAVDDAQSKSTYRYAIEAGAWIYLVEFGIVTGAKHYYFKNWFGTSVVDWKPITVECLENIRKTGKFPDYNDLY